MRVVQALHQLDLPAHRLLALDLLHFLLLVYLQSDFLARLLVHADEDQGIGALAYLLANHVVLHAVLVREHDHLFRWRLVLSHLQVTLLLPWLAIIWWELNKLLLLLVLGFFVSEPDRVQVLLDLVEIVGGAHHWLAGLLGPSPGIAHCCLHIPLTPCRFILGGGRLEKEVVNGVLVGQVLGLDDHLGLLDSVSPNDASVSDKLLVFL